MRLANAFLACAGSAAAVLAATVLFAPSGTASAANPPVAAAADETGTIKGRIVFGGEAPKLLEIDVKTQPYCNTKTVLDRSLAVDPKSKGVGNVLVWLPTPKGKNVAAEKALLEKTPVVKIDNHNCEFLPRSTAMHKSQALEFTSSDAVGHNSHVMGFSYGCNLALAPEGKATAPKVQSEKRPMKLKCDIHGWMEGHILVCDHPFFAVTGEDGSFEITGVPAGTQNVIIWQEKAGFVSTGALKGQPVEVKAGGKTDLGNVVLDPTKVKK